MIYNGTVDCVRYIEIYSSSLYKYTGATPVSILIEILFYLLYVVVMKTLRKNPVYEAFVQRKIKNFVPWQKNKIMFLWEDGQYHEMKKIRASHPWGILKNFIQWYIKETGVDFEEFVRLINRPKEYIVNVIEKKADVDIDFAARLHLVLWTSMQIWMWIQTDYTERKNSQE